MYRNCIELAGYIDSEPEMRFLPDGEKVVNLRLIEKQTRGAAKIEYVNTFGLVFFGCSADTAVLYRKGDNLFVCGSLQQRAYTPADGSTRKVWEVVVNHSHIIAQRVRPAQHPEEPAQKTQGGYDAWPV